MTNYELIKERCANYLLEEPDEDLRLELLALKPGAELNDRMLLHLRFGTAGLRGRMEAGYNRMNIPAVYRLAYALGHEIPNARVVIAFDGRHKSELFAREVAQILGRLGAEIFIFSESVPTPLCAFATKYLGAHVGVMITASHNPAYDNGVKLFDQRGAQAHGQILANIEQAMAKAPLRSDFYAQYKSQVRSIIIGEKIFQAYTKAINNTKLFSSKELDKSINIMYTAMHGVGQKFFLRAAHEEGFQNISFVKEQAAPDGSFPTVGFPNPEEEHSLDLAHTEAKKNKISWVFANDPDADRLQVSNLNFSRDFVKLSGNQMGSILGYFAIKKALELGEKPLVASSIVSSRMLKTMALSQGAYYVDALTGFSNIADAALKAQEKTHSKFVFAYEESIGFLVGNVVLDKDGINAGVRFLEIAAWLEREKISVWELLDQLYVRFGLFSNNSWSERFLGIQATSLMSAVMTRVRSLSLDELGSKLGVKYLRKYDLAQAEINSPYAAISANVVIFENENFRLIIRPSGTEPKIKFYIEIIKDVENHNFLSTEKSQSADNLRELRSAIEKILK